MTKAQFHRHQKVWVEAVGVWAVIDKISPVWAKGFEEPVKITYDVGLGREFLAEELRADDRTGVASGQSNWRLLRARNKWQEPEDCRQHPFPGTYPVVVTDAQDWGGWRVPGAEYDRDPHEIETQARMIVATPKLVDLAHDLQRLVAEAPDDAPAELQALARRASELLRAMVDAPPQSEAEPAAARPRRTAA